MVVESFPGVECSLRGVANEGGRDLVTFAEPELQNVGAADPRIGDFANARCG